MVGGFLMQGLGNVQIEERNKTKAKILKYLYDNEPASYSKIAFNAGVVDRRAIRKALDELCNEGKVSSVYNKYIGFGRSKTVYYTNPPSIEIHLFLEKINNIIIRSTDYCFGIKNNIPLLEQYKHKLKILNNLSPIVAKRIEKVFSAIEDAESRNNRRMALKKEMEEGLRKKKSSRCLHIRFDSPSYSDYENSLRWFTKDIDTFSSLDVELQRLYLESLDKIVRKIGTDFRKIGIIDDHTKLRMVSSLWDNPIRRVAKRFRHSDKLVSKIYKEYFNEDGLMKHDKLDELNERINGPKEYVITNKEKLDVVLGRTKLKIPKFRNKLERFKFYATPIYERVPFSRYLELQRAESDS